MKRAANGQTKEIINNAGAALAESITEIIDEIQKRQKPAHYPREQTGEPRFALQLPENK
jgi:hypothetical protein